MCLLSSMRSNWPYPIDEQLPAIKINGRWQGTEAEAKCDREDERRVTKLHRAALDYPKLAPFCRSLADRLDSDTPPQTTASSRYTRDRRINIIGAVEQLADEWPDEQLRLPTILPRSIELSSSTVPSFDPTKATSRLRQQCVRRGALESTGFLIVFLEMEHDPTLDIVRWHYHGVVAGGMIQILREVRRGLPDEYRKRPGVSKPFQLNRLDASKRAEGLSYILKSYDKERPTIRVTGDDGKVLKRRILYGKRLSEPLHTHSLMFRDQHSLCEIALLMRCRATRTGFALTDPELNAAYMTRKRKMG